MQDYMELQECWEVIEYMNWELTRVAEILTRKEWRIQNAKARIHIRDNISMEDITETRHLESAGEIWKHLMKRYEAKNEAKEIIALERVLIWIKDPSKSVKESLKELERLNTELKEISEGKNSIRNRTLMFIFLKGLTKEFEAVRSGIIGLGGEAFQQDVVLSKLQTVERWAKNSSSEDAAGGQISKVANRVFSGNCFTCRKPGHKVYECEKGRGLAGQAREQNRGGQNCGGGGNRGRSGPARGGQNYRGNRQNAKPHENARAADQDKINKPPYFKEEGDDKYEYSKTAARAVEIRLDE
jgi:hypothetical protein